jgi:hypothetical protein
LTSNDKQNSLIFNKTLRESHEILTTQPDPESIRNALRQRSRLNRPANSLPTFNLYTPQELTAFSARGVPLPTNSSLGRFHLASVALLESIPFNNFMNDPKTVSDYLAERDYTHLERNSGRLSISQSRSSKKRLSFANNPMPL